MSRLLYVACLLLSAVSSVQAGESLDLSSGWVFRTDPGNVGLTEGWQSVHLDDSRWQPLGTDSNYESQGIDYDGFSWYRLRFDVTEDVVGGSCILSLGPVDDADETFLNGELIGATGVMGDMDTTEWTSPRTYVIPVGKLRPGSNVLAVRVWDQRGGGGIYQGPVFLASCGGGHVATVSRRPWGLDVKLTTGGRLRLQVYGDESIRVRQVREGLFRDWLADEWMLSCREPTAAQFTTQQEDGRLWLRTARMQVCVQTSPLRLSFFDHNGRLLTQEAAGAWWAGGQLGVSLTCREDEHFLGLGEYGDHIDRRGQSQEMWVVHSYSAKDIPVPFVLSSRGWGLLWCNSFRGSVNVCPGQMDTVSCRAEGGEIDYFVMCGDEPKDVVSTYTSLTGRSPLPPKWAFGYWQSRCGWGSQDWALGTAKRLRADGFPLDVLHMDGWSDGDLRFSSARFADAQGMLDELRSMGVKVCIWETPFVAQGWRMYAEGNRRGYFATDAEGRTLPVTAWVGDGLGLLDFLNPAACAWWQAAHRSVLSMGIGVVKTDGGDTAEVPEKAVFFGRKTGHEVHNLYPLLFNHCVYEGQQRERPGQRVINWTRTGYAGIQRYPCTWGGDQASTFEGGRTLVRAGINAGVCGIAFWGHDLGGFAAGRTKEYYVRSCQWGFLSPLSRIHGTGENVDRAIDGNEPWVYGSEAEEIIRRYAKLRYRLLPYLYTYAHIAHRTGLPIMRAMPLEFPDDVATYACDYQYMLGSELLVAPIVESTDRPDLCATRSIYLPAGQWYDYWTGEPYDGPARLRYEAPFDRLPLFVRAGAIVPYGPEITSIDGPGSRELTVEVYAGPESSFDLIEDDGVSLGYVEGEVATATMRHTESEQGRWHLTTLALSAPRGSYDGMPKMRAVTVRFRGCGKVLAASVNGRPASFETDADGVVSVGPVAMSRAAAVSVSSAR